MDFCWTGIFAIDLQTDSGKDNILMNYALEWWLKESLVMYSFE